MKKVLKEYKDKLIILVLIILTGYPIVEHGIMCNDELLLRLWSQQGLTTFFKTTIINENILKGRILAVLGNVKFLSYLSENRYIFGTINYIVILIAVALFSYLIYRLFNNKSFSIMLGICIIVCLPLTFEFAPPNAFIIVSFQPLICEIISLIYYINYLEEKKRKNLVLCLLFFIWGCFFYEFVITYVMLYPMIYVIKNKDYLKMKMLIKENYAILVAAIVYLFLYVGQGMIFPTDYSGNQMGIKSIKAVFNVLKMLFISACPGYYAFFNDKHAFLFHLYNGGTVSLQNLYNPIIIIFSVVLFYLLYKCVQSEKSVSGRTKEVMVCLVALIYGFLPALPNAVSIMYQENVNEESFTSLPVSVFLFFSIMFLLIYIIWNLLRIINKKVVSIFIVAILVFGACKIQMMNYVFAAEQGKNFTRIEYIEDLLELDYWEKWGQVVISAPSLYETKNSLAVERGHWTTYAGIYGNEIVLDGQTDSVWKLEMQDDFSFLLYKDDDPLMILFSKGDEAGELCVKKIDKSWNIVEVIQCIEENEEYKIYMVQQIK